MPPYLQICVLLVSSTALRTHGSDGGLVEAEVEPECNTGAADSDDHSLMQQVPPGIVTNFVRRPRVAGAKAGGAATARAADAAASAGTNGMPPVDSDDAKQELVEDAALMHVNPQVEDAEGDEDVNASTSRLAEGERVADEMADASADPVGAAPRPPDGGSHLEGAASSAAEAREEAAAAADAGPLPANSTTAAGPLGSSWPTAEGSASGANRSIEVPVGAEAISQNASATAGGLEEAENEALLESLGEELAMDEGLLNETRREALVEAAEAALHGSDDAARGIGDVLLQQDPAAGAPGGASGVSKLGGQLEGVFSKGIGDVSMPDGIVIGTVAEGEAAFEQSDSVSDFEDEEKAAVSSEPAAAPDLQLKNQATPHQTAPPGGGGAGAAPPPWPAPPQRSLESLVRAEVARGHAALAEGPAALLEQSLKQGLAENLSQELSATTLMRAVPVISLLFLALVLVAVTAAHCFGCSRGLEASTARRQQVEGLLVTSDREIHSMLSVSNDGDGDEKVTQPTSLGTLVRLQGTVVARPGGSLTGPFSSRPCVMYSASVSDHRQDGVHQPPVAFHTSAADFAIELVDAPGVLLAVHSTDVVLFDMQGGRFASEAAFTEAPDQWKGFVVAHAVGSRPPGQGQVGTQANLGDRGVLEFRECALVVGSMVTCVGEVARDRNGSLGLLPWRPPPNIPPFRPSQPDGGVAAKWTKAMPWILTSWEGRRCGGAVTSSSSDALAGHILVSDDVTLLE